MKMLKHMTNAQYHRARAVSRSNLQDLRIVPAGAKVERSDSVSAFIGTAAHTKILEPDRYEGSVVESVNKSITGKDYQYMIETFPEKAILPAGGLETVEQLSKSIMLHPKSKDLLGGNYFAEPSFFWKDEDTGIWCKTRPDFVDFDRGIIGDLKFLAKGKADPRKFTWTCRDYGYDLQAAWNIYGIKQVTGKLFKEFWFVVCETDEPYRTACYQLDDEWLGDALWECKALLQKEAECREAGEWPNYTSDNIDGEMIFRGI